MGWADRRANGRADGQTGAQADEGSGQAGGQADERMGADNGRTGRQADGGVRAHGRGGQWRTDFRRVKLLN